MLTKDEPENRRKECHEALKTPERVTNTVTTSDAICGAVGLLVLMLMLLIATGTVPLYDWQHPH